jgi:hypothetical protein
LVDLESICSKYCLETWCSPNDDIRICLLDMQRSWTKKHFLSWIARNDVYGVYWFNLPYIITVLRWSLRWNVLTIDTNCRNQILYFWLVNIQIICTKYGLETWFPPNEDIRKYLLHVQRSWTQNASWNLNNKKLRNWCKFVSPFLFNNTYCLPVLTMGTKYPNQLFYVWLVDLHTICAKQGLETWFFPTDDIRKYLLEMLRS